MDAESKLTSDARSFWAAYVTEQVARGEPSPRLYDTMVIGGDAASTDAGAGLILSGKKTATSALPSDFEGPNQRPPRPGDLSLVLDGSGNPVCIVQTKWVLRQQVGDVDEAFARDYGEWDGTLATWRERILAYYADQLLSDPLATPLLCERFLRIWPEYPI